MDLKSCTNFVNDNFENSEKKYAEKEVCSYLSEKLLIQSDTGDKNVKIEDDALNGLITNFSINENKNIHKMCHPTLTVNNEKESYYTNNYDNVHNNINNYIPDESNDNSTTMSSTERIKCVENYLENVAKENVKCDSNNSNNNNSSNNNSSNNNNSSRSSSNTYNKSNKSNKIIIENQKKEEENVMAITTTTVNDTVATTSVVTTINNANPSGHDKNEQGQEKQKEYIEKNELKHTVNNVNESTNSNSVVQENINDDRNKKEAHEKDTVEKDTVEKDTVEKDTVEKDTVEKDTVEKDTFEKDMVEKDMVEKDTVEKDTVEKDMVEKDMVEKDMVEKDMVEKDMVEKDTVEKDTVEKDTVEKDTVEMAEKRNVISLENLFDKSLLNNEDIQKNISSKNFYIIGEDILINITLIIDKLILELIDYYNKNKIIKHDEVIHFQSFWKILCKLLSNIYYYPHEKKYKIIKFSNNVIKDTFLINVKIFNLLKLLFEILNFNTEYGTNNEINGYTNNLTSSINDSKNNFHHTTNNINIDNNYEKQIWKFENVLTDKESILFEFVLSSVHIVMNIINENKKKNLKKNNKMKNINNNISPHHSPVNSPTETYHKNNYIHTNRYTIEQKKQLEYMINNTMPFNKKIPVIYEKDKKEKEALNDIRKLHYEKYHTNKKYAVPQNNTNHNKNEKHRFFSNIYNRNRSNKKTETINIDKDNKKNNFFKNNSFYNEQELNNKNKFKKGKKKIKNFFKKLFKPKTKI
ncbi:conserved protein, unknown function [Hepatocystis sp. ex Piliocolobus tephrosceles]|nr:conserved protein, unknown function [Hepatocystis sp. ex Piliocolobus tephrosceles]